MERYKLIGFRTIKSTSGHLLTQFDTAETLEKVINQYSEEKEVTLAFSNIELEFENGHLTDAILITLWCDFEHCEVIISNTIGNYVSDWIRVNG